MARKKTLSGSSTHHANQVARNLKRAEVQLKEAITSARHKRCADALSDFGHANVNLGSALTHMGESGQVSDADARRVAELANDTKDTINNFCFRK